MAAMTITTAYQAIQATREIVREHLAVCRRRESSRDPQTLIPNPEYVMCLERAEKVLSDLKRFY